MACRFYFGRLGVMAGHEKVGYFGKSAALASYIWNKHMKGGGFNEN